MYNCSTCRGHSPCCWENPATWDRAHKRYPTIDGRCPLRVRLWWALRRFNGLARRHGVS